MQTENRDLAPDEQSLIASLLEEMAGFSETVGDNCLDDLPRHLGFGDTLKLADIRRETLVAILFATGRVLSDLYEPEIAERVASGLASGGFLKRCLAGNTGEFNTLDDLLKNRFECYVKARSDPVAENETLRCTMMGVVAACSLGLEDEARMQFAAHVGAHIMVWRECLRRALLEQ